MVPCTVRIKKKVIHIQRPIVLKSINFNIWMWPVYNEQLILFPLVPFLHHIMSRITEYIAIEDDIVISHFLQVLLIGMDCTVNAVIGNSDG